MDINQLNNDQKKVILALANPEQFYRGFQTVSGIRGVPYKKIVEVTKLSIEKALLSIGWMEALELVKHDIGIIRKTLDYLGRSNVEISGQDVIRMFYLTKEGKNLLKKLESKGEKLDS